MDFDILCDILREPPSVLSGDLLQHLSSSGLTDQDPTSEPSLTNVSIASFTHSKPDGNTAAVVISKVEDIFESIAECLLDEKKEMVIRLKTRKRSGLQVHDIVTGTLTSLQNDEMRSIKFPSKSPQEAWKFSE